MKVLVTYGPTREFIDDVRFITNISTGATGSAIARAFETAGHDVVQVVGNGVDALGGRRTVFFTSTADLERAMRQLVPRVDVVVHAAAVADFTFGNTGEAAFKLKSSSKEDFAAWIAEHIQYAPNILAQIKQWHPQVTLVGFKFESGVPHETLIERALESIAKKGCDAVLANDKTEMAQTHRAYLVDDHGHEQVLQNNEEIAQALVDFTTKRHRARLIERHPFMAEPPNIEPTITLTLTRQNDKGDAHGND